MPSDSIRKEDYVKAGRLAAIHLLFDMMPGPQGCCFIESEDGQGNSIKAGEWRERPDGKAELVIQTVQAKGEVTDAMFNAAMEAATDFEIDPNPNMVGAIVRAALNA